MTGLAASRTRDMRCILDEFTGPSGTSTLSEEIQVGPAIVTKYTNEFWTSRQRQATSIHEISYRACFKPQLPRFFIRFLTREGDTVYDPFNGRGTTTIEAALLGRRAIANDANPLSRVMTLPRLSPPYLYDVSDRLAAIPMGCERAEIDLSMFYHPDTEREIVSIRKYLLARISEGTDDPVDRWIAMVATNRLTGHSRGFFSVYTLPPNQAVSPERQKKINEKRCQVPEYRDTRRIIISKTKSLLRTVTAEDAANLHRAGETALMMTGDAQDTPEIRDDSVNLTVTSPPFLDIVQYREDNWLRCWFCGLDAVNVGRGITMARTVEQWTRVMGRVFKELFRITAPGGHVAFEVGEVRNGTIRLEEHVVPLGISAGFIAECILINQQSFTKTSNIWGVGNMASGTNTNRIVLFRKP